MDDLFDNISMIGKASRESMSPYFSEHSYQYASTEDFVSQKGHMGKSGCISDEGIGFLMTENFGAYKAHQCFRNAYRLAERGCWAGQDIEYVEGFATTGFLWTVHAWNELDGIVVDLTFGPVVEIAPKSGKTYMRRKSRVVGDIPEGFEYLGVSVPLNDVRAHIFKHEQYSPIIDDWCHEWPLLQGA